MVPTPAPPSNPDPDPGPCVDAPSPAVRLLPNMLKGLDRASGAEPTGESIWPGSAVAGKMALARVGAALVDGPAADRVVEVVLMVPAVPPPPPRPIWCRGRVGIGTTLDRKGASALPTTTPAPVPTLGPWVTPEAGLGPADPCKEGKGEGEGEMVVLGAGVRCSSSRKDLRMLS